jgi:HPt (histidine-containing phosphotransfer) domain-containing protein
MQGDRQACEAAGMDDYIAKPVRLQELQRVLSRSAEGRCRPGAGEPHATLEKTPQPIPPAFSTQDAPQELDGLRAISEGNPERMRQLATLYLAEAGEVMKALESALSDGAARQVSRLAHKLAGSSEAIGMSPIAVPMRQLERQGRQGDLSEAHRSFAQAIRQWERIRRLLESDPGQS